MLLYFHDLCMTVTWPLTYIWVVVGMLSEFCLQFLIMLFVNMPTFDFFSSLSKLLPEL